MNNYLGMNHNNWTNQRKRSFFKLGLSLGWLLCLNLLSSELVLAQTTPPNKVQQRAESEQVYRLGGGDKISIDIFQSPEYSGEQLIPSDGILTLPLVGNISVRGITLQQLTQELSMKYGQILKRPIITVRLITPRTVTVGVTGEVIRPGAYTLNVNSQGYVILRNPALIEGIQAAGGVALTANIENIEVRRSISQGQEQTIKVNLWEYLQSNNSEQNIPLRDGDTIFVPPQTKPNLAIFPKLVSSGLLKEATQAIQIAIVGEINRPGTYSIIERGDPRGDLGGAKNPKVTRAIQAAGGITSQADIRNISLKRLTRSNLEQTITINLWQLIQSGDFNQDIFLQDGDVITVPTATDINPAEVSKLAGATFSPETIKIYVVGEVARPGVVEVPPNTPLNQAIFAAGGFNQQRAYRQSVDLIRLNSNGSVSKLPVSVELGAGINEQTNPLLLKNDVIVVKRSGLATVSDTVTIVVQPVGAALNIIRILESFGLTQPFILKYN